jgi:hypothetical protein
MASAFRHWLNANLVIQYGVDAVYVEYIQSSLEDGDDGLDELLDSLAPDEPNLRKVSFRMKCDSSSCAQIARSKVISFSD